MPRITRSTAKRTAKKSTARAQSEGLYPTTRLGTPVYIEVEDDNPTGRDTDRYIPQNKARPGPLTITIPKPRIENNPVSNLFNVKVDTLSEAELIRLVEGINHKLDHFVSTIGQNIKTLILTHEHHLQFDYCQVQELTRSTSPALYSAMPYMTLVHQRLQSPTTKHETRSSIVDLLLHHEICHFLEEQFFSNNLGPGTEDCISKSIDRLFHEINKNNPWATAQTWRTMTTKAKASLKGSCLACKSRIVKQTSNALLDRVVPLIKMVYPIWDKAGLHEIVNISMKTVFQSGQALINQSYDFCIKTSQEVVTSSVKVTTAPTNPDGRFANFSKKVNGIDIREEAKPKTNEHVLGTFKFGLSAQYEDHVKVLLRPQVLTKKYFSTLP